MGAGLSVSFGAVSRPSSCSLGGWERRAYIGFMGWVFAQSGKEARMGGCIVLG